LLFAESFRNRRKIDELACKQVDTSTCPGEKKCVQTLLAAFQFLTICGSFGARDPAPETVGRASGYFVVVGLALGLLLAVANYILAPHLDAGVLSLLLVSLLIIATGARHISGMKDSFTALGGFNERANETLGVVAIALVILFKSTGAESMDDIATSSWLLTPILARWGLLIFLYGYHTRFDETAHRLAERVNFVPVFVSTAATLALAVYFFGRKGLWIALAVSIFLLLLREIFYRRHAALSRAHLGAAVEISEALSLVLLASL
jgi:cobalamin synthase